MNNHHYGQILELESMKPAALRARYREVFGEPSRSGNTTWLRKRIAWRIQSLAEGPLSERARCRAAELANEADLRTRAPQDQMFTQPVPNLPVPVSAGRDPRLPKPGTLLSRVFKGKQIVVEVRENDFVLDGNIYASLSAIAQEVTGTRWNGFQFFGLKKRSAA